MARVYKGSPKNKMKKILFSLIMIIYLFSNIISIQAKEYSKTIDTEIKQLGLHMFEISWSNYPIKVEVIAPSGTIYNSDNAYFSYENSKGIYFAIDAQEVGTYGLVLTKDREESQDIEISVNSMMEGWIKADNISLSKPKSSIEVKYQLTGYEADNIEANVNIYKVDQLGNISEKIMTHTDYVSTGQGSINIKTNAIPKGDYKVEVIFSTIFYEDTHLIDEIVSISGDTKYEPITARDLITKDESVEIIWEQRNSIDYYEVALFDQPQGSPIELVETEELSHIFDYLYPEIDYYYSIVGVFYDGSKTIEEIRPLDRNKLSEMNLTINWPDKERLNVEYIDIGYTVNDNIYVDIYLNGQRIMEDLIGNQQLAIKMKQGENTLGILAKDNFGNEYSQEKSFYVDSIAPVLLIYSDENEITNSMTLIGKTEGNATVTLNGQAIEIDQKGNFTIDLNSFKLLDNNELMATDTMGNEANYTFSINESLQQEKSNKNFIKYVGAISAGIFTTGYIIINISRTGNN